MTTSILDGREAGKHEQAGGDGVDRAISVCISVCVDFSAIEAGAIVARRRAGRVRQVQR